jgi:membrane dipeptidase
MAALGAGAIMPARAQAKPLLHADMHSHVNVIRHDLREAMIRNGMLLVAHTVSADRLVIRNEPGKGFRQIREPQPGELAAEFDTRIARMRADHQANGLTAVTDGAALDRLVGGNTPAVLLAAEGGDFIDGDLKRLEAARAQGVIHVQLVHYRVSEIGDISTALPVHGGLTPFGKDVVRACNQLGILVDIAHATHEGMAQALEISTKPMVYSHGHVITGTPHWTHNARRARGIAASMARAIAERGGVVGLWSSLTQYRTLDGYAGALMDAAATLGYAHVGVGTDMGGLPAGSVVPTYDEFGALEELLGKRGAKPPEVRAILGGNYLRVLRHALTV